MAQAPAIETTRLRAGSAHLDGGQQGAISVCVKQETPPCDPRRDRLIGRNGLIRAAKDGIGSMKTFFIGCAALAVVAALASPAWADDLSNNNIGIAVSHNELTQQVSNSISGGSYSDILTNMDASMVFGSDTFRNQVGNVNQFATGIQNTQQSAVSIAFATGGGSASAGNGLGSSVINGILSGLTGLN